MIDTHCHFNSEDFEKDLDEVIKNAINNNVNKLIIVGFDKKTNDKALEISNKYSFCYPTCGIHPEEANNTTNEDFIALEERIKTGKYYAVGECGLDYYWISDNKERQKEIFRFQIELSIKYSLPLIIHLRDAFKDTLDILKEYPMAKGVMHGFSGSVESMNEFIKLGFYIALGGPVTFKNAVTPKEVAKAIPLDKLLLETDCPYLTPHPFRGKRNESAYVKIICEKIAELKELPFDVIDEATTNNAIKLFKL